MKNIDVIGIGNPLIDILVKSENKLADEFKLAHGAFNLVEEKVILKIMEKIKPLETEVHPGDSTANTITGVASLGGKVAYFGKVGKDEHGVLFERSLLKDSVAPKLAKDSDITGKVIVFLSKDGERTFATYLGASQRLNPQDIDEDIIKDAKILHLTGYQLENPILKETAIHAMDLAKKHKTLVSIDLADAGLVKRNLKELRDIVKTYADIVFANETEAEAFTSRDPEEALQNIGNYCDYAFVKIGAQGSLVKHKGNMHKIAGFKVNAIDTTGAGDMYAAVVLYGLTHDISVEKSARMASYAAAKVVEKVGARLKLNLEELKKV